MEPWTLLEPCGTVDTLGTRGTVDTLGTRGTVDTLGTVWNRGHSGN